MTKREERKLAPEKRLLLLTAVLVLVGFVLIQVLFMEKGGRGASSRISELMASTQAEIVGMPLTETQAKWTLVNEKGESFTLESLPPDTLVFLNFWATWCPPCRRELPSMLGLRDLMTDYRFLMVAVSYDESFDEIQSFFEEWVGKLPPPNQLLTLKDPHIDEGTTLRETFGTKEIPDTYVILNGKVLSRFVNERTWTHQDMVEYFQSLAKRW